MKNNNNKEEEKEEIRMTKLYYQDKLLGEVSADKMNSAEIEEVNNVLKSIGLDIWNFEHVEAFHLEESGDFVLHKVSIKILDNAGIGKLSYLGMMPDRNIQDIFNYNNSRWPFLLYVDGALLKGDEI